jgi:hypothetical protein
MGEELWEVGYTDIALCDKATDASKCIKDLRAPIANRGQELCGERLKAEVLICEKTQRKGLYAVVCKVKCAEQAGVTPGSIQIAQTDDISFNQSISELRTILNSQRVNSLFGVTGIALVVRVGKNVYVLASDKKNLCVRAETLTNSDGEVSLKDVNQVDCKDFL